MNTKTITLEAVTEAVNILYILARVDQDKRWITDSVPIANLNRMARKLGFPNALAIQERIEGDKEHETNKYRDLDSGWF